MHDLIQARLKPLTTCSMQLYGNCRYNAISCADHAMGADAKD
jgi:hypothetical protein